MVELISVSKPVAVVGGGPVGSAVALLLHSQGLPVVMIDAGASQSKVCGEGILPAGWEVLEELGLASSIVKRSSIQGLVYRLPTEDGWQSMTAPLTRSAYGVKREHLFSAFRSELEARGIPLYPETTLTDVSFQSDRLELNIRSKKGGCRTVDCGFLVGADGLHSTVRRKTGLQGDGKRDYGRWGARCYFHSTEERHYVEVTLGRGLESYLTPLGESTYGLAFLWSPEQLGRPLPGEGPVFRRLLDLLPPGFREQIPSVESEFWGGEKAIGPLQQEVPSPLHPSGRVALVGDAAGYFDALTGEGLCLGLRQAAALAHCLAQDKVERYPGLHRGIKWRHKLVVSGLLWLIHQPRLRQRVFTSLASAPEQFEAVIRFAVEEASWSTLLSPQLPRFLFRLLFPKH